MRIRREGGASTLGVNPPPDVGGHKVEDPDGWRALAWEILGSDAKNVAAPDLRGADHSAYRRGGSRIKFLAWPLKPESLGEYDE